ncbi:TetR/AcrR family transcriptional regulator [Actinomadura parmotrematis]|uniref:TetR/AcrR family transcriptional regulator n=1 Tax=Actinomadura parmotrematis TaxID=2864039 RepID=A0ABS7FK98_9ACTN|nr:TetR/AcrR family transcriptional regulator [Actinomadura parmotrematis]MBW8480785.1 TetR/AcrR family transcriptional regulator [Actinomadura parmotrematis]
MTQTTARPPGRPRSERAEKAILEATLDLLGEESGVAGVSIEAVAARAGVGKTTIYRRWANKEALIVSALAYGKDPLPEPPGHSARADLLELVRALAAGRNGPHGRCFHNVVGGAEKFPALYERYQHDVIEPRRELMRGVLRRWVERGEFRPDLDLDVVVTLLVGAATLKTAEEVLPADWPEQVVATLLHGIAL